MKQIEKPTPHITKDILCRQHMADHKKYSNVSGDISASVDGIKHD